MSLIVRIKYTQEEVTSALESGARELIRNKDNSRYNTEFYQKQADILRWLSRQISSTSSILEMIKRLIGE